MAEIDIEKKKSSNKSPWLWILALLVLAGVIWWIAAEDEKPITAYDAPEVAETEEVGQIEKQTVSDEYLENEEEVNTEEVIRDYVGFVETRFEGADFNLNHEYTSEGILKLQNALAVLAREKTDMGREIRDEMETLESYAQEIQTDPEALRHAELIQQAFTGSAEIMEKIKEEEDADYVNKVREAANDISAETPALEQKAAIKAFFVTASEAVERMSDKVGSGQEAEETQETEQTEGTY